MFVHKLLLPCVSCPRGSLPRAQQGGPPWAPLKSFLSRLPEKVTAQGFADLLCAKLCARCRDSGQQGTIPAFTRCGEASMQRNGQGRWR